MTEPDTASGTPDPTTPASSPASPDTVAESTPDCLWLTALFSRHRDDLPLLQRLMTLLRERASTADGWMPLRVLLAGIDTNRTPVIGDFLTTFVTQGCLAYRVTVQSAEHGLHETYPSLVDVPVTLTAADGSLVTVTDSLISTQYRATPSFPR